MDILIYKLNKRYKDKVVLNNLDISFKDKYASFIIGRSGSGKTTLARILMNLEKLDSGQIIGVKNKSISAVLQDDSLCENLSVLLNIKLVCKNISDKEIEKSLEEVDLKSCLNKRIRQLSGGMKRRVAIIRALLYNFDLIIMDEPFKGLDTKTKKKVMDFTIRKIENKTAIIITHDLEEVKYFADNKELISCLELESL